ncbi:MAG: 50S ribosomal protein L6 [Acidobacteriota bacterium]
MSRIGKRPIDIPVGIKVRTKEGLVHVEGGKGKLTYKIPDGIGIRIDDSRIIVTRSSDTGSQKALHGLMRALLNNAVKGLTEGFKKELEIEGIGYKAQVQGRVVSFNLGHTHQIDLAIPEGLDVKIDKQTKITVTGYDKQRVGQFARIIKELKIPDVYKHKGIKYAGELLRKKVGKTGA